MTSLWQSGMQRSMLRGHAGGVLGMWVRRGRTGLRQTRTHSKHQMNFGTKLPRTCGHNTRWSLEEVMGGIGSVAGSNTFIVINFHQNFNVQHQIYFMFMLTHAQ